MEITEIMETIKTMKTMKTKFTMKKVKNGNTINMGVFVDLDKAIEAIAADTFNEDRERWGLLLYDELLIDFIEQLKKNNKIEMKFGKITYKIDIDED